MTKSIYIRGSRFGLDEVKRLDYFCQRSATTTNWNAHDGIELHYLLKGSLKWEFKDGRQPLTVTGGSLLAIPANTVHRVIGGNVSPAIRLGAILCPPNRHVTTSAWSHREFGEIYANISQAAGKVFCTSSQIKEVAGRVRTYMTGFSPDNTLSALKLRHQTATLLCEIATEMTSPRFQDGNRHDIKALATAIARAPGTSVSELIERSGYGRTRFFALFQELFGMSPCDYINRTRIQKAKKLLCGKRTLPMSKIARLTGFSSASVFSNAFRRYVGTTPLRFSRLAS